MADLVLASIAQRAKERAWDIHDVDSELTKMLQQDLGAQSVYLLRNNEHVELALGRMVETLVHTLPGTPLRAKVISVLRKLVMEGTIRDMVLRQFDVIGFLSRDIVALAGSSPLGSDMPTETDEDNVQRSVADTESTGSKRKPVILDGGHALEAHLDFLRLLARKGEHEGMMAARAPDLDVANLLEHLLACLEDHAPFPRRLALHIGVLGAFVRGRVGMQMWIKSHPRMNTALRALIQNLHHRSIGVVAQSLAVLVCLTMGDALGAKLFSPNNIDESFRLTFGIISKRRKPHLVRIAMDILEDMIENESVLGALETWDGIQDALSMLTELMGTDHHRMAEPVLNFLVHLQKHSPMLSKIIRQNALQSGAVPQAMIWVGKGYHGRTARLASDYLCWMIHTKKKRLPGDDAMAERLASFVSHGGKRHPATGDWGDRMDGALRLLTSLWEQGLKALQEIILQHIRWEAIVNTLGTLADAGHAPATVRMLVLLLRLRDQVSTVDVEKQLCCVLRDHESVFTAVAHVLLEHKDASLLSSAFDALLICIELPFISGNGVAERMHIVQGLRAASIATEKRVQAAQDQEWFATMRAVQHAERIRVLEMMLDRRDEEDEQELHEANRAIDDLQVRLRGMEQDQFVRSSNDGEQLVTIKAEMRQLQELVEVKSAALQQADRLIEDNRKRRVVAEEEAEGHAREASALRQQCEILARERGDVNEVARDLGKVNEQLQHQLREQDQETSLLQHRHKESSVKTKVLEEQLLSTEKMLDTARQEASRIRMQQNMHQERMQEMQKKLQDAEERNSDVEMSLATANVEMERASKASETLRQENARSLDRLQHMEQQMALLRTQLKDRDRQLEEMHQQREQQGEECKQLRGQLALIKEEQVMNEEEMRRMKGVFALLHNLTGTTKGEEAVQ